MILFFKFQKHIILRFLKSIITYYMISIIKYIKYITKDVIIGWDVYIRNSDIASTRRLGNSTVLRECKIDDMTSIGKNCTVNYADIVKYCSISWMVTICAIYHSKSSLTTNAFPYSKKLGVVTEGELVKDRTKIGNDVWIRCNCVILPNLIIGNAVIIGVGSVVTKSIEPYTIVTGYSAKKIIDRLSNDIEDELIELKWWQFSEQLIKSNASLFVKNVDDELLNKVRKID